MTSRHQQIEAFLNEIYVLSKNKSDNINCDFVYNRLIFNNIKAEKMCNQGEFFPYWQEHYSSMQNTKCFVSSNWTYFCQFINENRDPFKEYGEDPIKIYVSLDKYHLFEGAKIIFDYLDKENISHRSKIGKETRVDNIVIRIFNKNDAQKVINFINNNRYLTEGHNEVSPFNFKCGIVGLAVDNYNSYNTILSEFIAEYINKIKNKFPPRKPKLEDFYKYLEKIKVDNELIYRISGEKNPHSIDIMYVNEIKSLILKSLVTDDLRVYIDHYENVIGNAKTKRKVDKLDKNSEIIYDTIQATLIVTNEKYGKEHTIFALKKYLENGDASSITRESLNGQKIRETICKIDNNIIKEFVLAYTKTSDTLEALEIIYNEIYKENIVRY